MSSYNNSRQTDPGKESPEESTSSSRQNMFFQLFFEEAPYGIFLADFHNVIIDVNAKACRLLGYSRMELLGLTVQDLIHPDDVKDQPICSWKDIADFPGGVQAQRRYRRKDGIYIDVEIHLKSVAETDINVVMFRDITKQKQAEAGLRESEKRYRTLFEKAGDAIFILGTDGQETGKILDANQAAADMHGYSIAELCEKCIQDLDTPDAAAAAPERIRQMLDGHWIKAEIRHRKKDGSEFPVEISAGLIELEGRRYIFAFDRDITERSRAEEKKAALEARLNQAQKMEALGTLAGGIAHDFNNILAGILGYTQLAQFEIPENTKVQNYLAGIEKAGKRARDLVQQILAFSRQSKPEKQPLDLAVITKEALKLLRASLPSSIQIRTDIQRHLGIVLADPTQIHQVLMNLCANAFHAMRADGGILEIRIHDAYIDTNEDISQKNKSLHPGKYLKLSVVDTGCGMDEQILAHIFEPYFTTKEVGEGTGLGLAVVHGIMENHGGAIQVESRPGQGTAFHVYFPCIAEERELAEVRAKLLPPAKGSGRILFVDDEEDLVDVGKHMLEMMQYTARCYHNPKEALLEFAENAAWYDLVITDMTMPQMTGLQLAREITRLRPGIPVVLCTGFNRAVTPENTAAAGICKILKKPVAVQELAEVLQQILKKG